MTELVASGANALKELVVIIAAHHHEYDDDCSRDAGCSCGWQAVVDDQGGSWIGRDSMEEAAQAYAVHLAEMILASSSSDVVEQ